MVNAKFRQIETKTKNTHTQNRKQDQTDCQLKNQAKKTKQTRKHGEKKERKNRKER